jgi:hypothetical protein
VDDDGGDADVIALDEGPDCDRELEEDAIGGDVEEDAVADDDVAMGTGMGRDADGGDVESAAMAATGGERDPDGDEGDEPDGTTSIMAESSAHSERNHHPVQKVMLNGDAMREGRRLHS